MRWRLVLFIVLFAVFLVFIISNLSLENKCNISFGPFTAKEVPVFLTVFISLMAGMLCMLPFIFIRKKTSGKQDSDSSDKPSDSNLPNSSLYGID